MGSGRSASLRAGARRKDFMIRTFGTIAAAVILANPLLAQFVYVSNSSAIAGYTINTATGALTAVSGSPFPAPSFPQSVAVDPTGKFVYVPTLSTNIFGYTINSATGAPASIPRSPFQPRLFRYFRLHHQRRHWRAYADRRIALRHRSEYVFLGDCRLQGSSGDHGHFIEPLRTWAA